MRNVMTIVAFNYFDNLGISELYSVAPGEVEDGIRNIVSV